MPPNSGSLPRRRVGQHREAPIWASDSTISTPGRVGRPGKVAREERLVTGQLPRPGGRLAGFEGSHLGDEEKRLAMGQVVVGSHAAEVTGPFSPRRLRPVGLRT